MRTRIFSILLAICLVLTMFPVTAWASDKTYLALGDSISTGYGLTTPETESFPALVKAELGDGWTLVNKAMNGATTSSLLAALATEDYQSAVKAADVISLTVVGNDLMALLYDYLAAQLSTPDKPMTGKDVQALLTAGGGNLDQNLLNQIAAVVNAPDFASYFAPSNANITAIATNFAAVIGTIKALNPKAQLIVATQYNPYEFLANQAKPFAAFMPLAKAIGTLSATIEAALAVDASDETVTLNEKLLAAAGEYYTVVDVYTAFAGSSTQLCNAAMGAAFAVNMDFHPNAAGHARIAESIRLLLRTEEVAYTVTVRPTEGVIVTADVTAVQGSDFTFTVLPEEGYDPASLVVRVNGEIVEEAEAGYVVSNVQGDLVITVEIEKADQTVYLTMAGQTSVPFHAETLTYTLSVSNANRLATAELTMETDETLLTDLAATALNGWEIIGQAYESGKLTVTMMNIAGVNGEADLLSVSGRLTGEKGAAVLEVTDAKLAVYAGEGEHYAEVDWSDACFETEVTYDLYDVNRDGVVDLLDITRAQRWYSTDNEICDVNHDGIVNITDMILIMNHYTRQ